MTKQRIRRGQIVDIPEEWQGQVCHAQTRRRRRLKAHLKVLGRRRQLRQEERFESKNQAEVEIFELYEGRVAYRVKNWGTL